jgi:hypothetical protein
MKVWVAQALKRNCLGPVQLFLAEPVLREKAGEVGFEGNPIATFEVLDCELLRELQSLGFTAGHKGQLCLNFSLPQAPGGTAS